MIEIVVAKDKVSDEIMRSGRSSDKSWEPNESHMSCESHESSLGHAEQLLF